MATADVLVLRSTSTDGAPGAPGGWLGALLTDDEEHAADDGLHRYQGGRRLHTSGCRYLDVTGSPTDPAAVRLTVVWADDRPPGKVRRAFLQGWTDRAASLGWEPSDADELVGDVQVERYLPVVQPIAEPGEDGTDRPVLLHAWQRPEEQSSGGSRTSGRRT